jgi:FkbM family methyltransferase
MTNQLANVVCLQVALGSEDTTSAIYDLDKSFGPHVEDVSLHGDRNREPISVLVRSLDSVCSELDIRGLKLVKIDVEGHEAQVLNGMSRVISEFRPTIVFEALTSQKLKESEKILYSAGYSIKQVDGGNYLASP